MKIIVPVRLESGYYIAEFPGCVVSGDTLDTLRDRVNDFLSEVKSVPNPNLSSEEENIATLFFEFPIKPKEHHHSRFTDVIDKIATFFN